MIGISKGFFVDEVKNLEKIGTTEKLSALGLCGSVAGRKSTNSKERRLVLGSRFGRPDIFLVLSLISYSGLTTFDN